MDLSEFSTPPARILIHDPRDGGAVGAMHPARLEECNFLGVPDSDRLLGEYADFRAALAEHVPVTSLADLMDGDATFRDEATANPNLMFMRDSSLTLPWAPDLYIPARLKLESRKREPELAALALERLGLSRASISPTTNMSRAATSCRQWIPASESCCSASAFERPRRRQSGSRSN